jgi:hypothetical protein
LTKATAEGDEVRVGERVSLTYGDLRGDLPAGEDEGDGNLIIDEGIFLVQIPVCGSQMDESGYAEDIVIVCRLSNANLEVEL